MKSITELITECPMPMLQHREEIIPFLEWLIDEQHATRVVEIGTGPGGLTLTLGRLLEDTLLSIDLVRPDFGDHAKLLNARKFFSLSQNSHDAHVPDTIAQLLGGQQVDLLFVDGDHAYDGVKSDFFRYKPCVKAGGWVAFHDINASTTWPNMGVPQFWRELQGEKREWLVSSYSDEPPTWGGIGAIRV